MKTQGFALEWIEIPREIIESISKGGPIDPAEIDRMLTASPPSSTSSKRKVDPSKIKYSCPTCGLNAWAKMNAHLVCGDCEKQMQAG